MHASFILLCGQACLSLCNIDANILESPLWSHSWAKLAHAGFLYPALPTVLHKLCKVDGGNCVACVQGSHLPAEGGRWKRGEG